MEDFSGRKFVKGFSRRDFIKSAVLLPLVATGSAFARESSVKIELPPKPFEYYIKRGRSKGSTVLVVGGIHGNEIGSYKAADMLVNVEVEKGTLIVVPRSNFTSILANQRGYNGDMNRKFRYISKKDPDYPYVEQLKQLILELKPDVVVSLHDGFGFNRLNRNHWGQCVVIDESQYKNFPLYNIASYIINEANKEIKNPKWKLDVYNTQTFTSDRHLEQRKALTGWCLTHNIPAFCFEASKQLPTTKDKVKTHLTMLKHIFEIYSVKIRPSFDYLINEIDTYLRPKPTIVKLSVNGRLERVSSWKVFKVPKGSYVKILDINGTRGSFVVPDDINLNLNKLNIKHMLTFHTQIDNSRVFDFRVKVI